MAVGATQETDAARGGAIRRAIGSDAVSVGLPPPGERDAGSLRHSQAVQQAAEESAEWLSFSQQGKLAWHTCSAALGAIGGHGQESQSLEQSAKVVHVAAARRTKLSIKFNREQQQQVLCHAVVGECCASATAAEGQRPSTNPCEGPARKRRLGER